MATTSRRLVDRPGRARDLDPGLGREQRRGPVAHHRVVVDDRDRIGATRRVGHRARHSSWTCVPPAGQRRTSRIAPIASARCCMLSSPKWPSRSARAPASAGIPGPASSMDSDAAAVGGAVADDDRRPAVLHGVRQRLLGDPEERELHVGRRPGPVGALEADLAAGEPLDAQDQPVQRRARRRGRRGSAAGGRRRSRAAGRTRCGRSPRPRCRRPRRGAGRAASAPGARRRGCPPRPARARPPSRRRPGRAGAARGSRGGRAAGR